MEVRKLAALEDKHWWYAERRHLLAQMIEGVTPGTVLDIGAAGGGNTRVLRAAGWKAIPLEYGAEGAEVAHERGLPVIRADAMRLPFADNSLEMVTAFDVLEHLPDDDACVLEVKRLLKPGGLFQIAVPADPKLWSSHDEAVDHVRRYTRDGLVDLIERNGFEITALRSWMVLLRPAVALRRRTSSGSDLSDISPVLNAALRSVVVAERFLPVRNLPGVSLLMTARRP